MRNFMLGIILGSFLTGGLGFADSSFYNGKGQLSAPRGSQQQYDYYRQRQQFLDIAATRQAAQQLAQDTRLHPCGK